jgi:hypothetical protein
MIPSRHDNRLKRFSFWPVILWEEALLRNVLFEAMGKIWHVDNQD